MGEMNKQKDFICGKSNNYIQVPDVTLFGGYVWLSDYRQKIYKSLNIQHISNLRIVSMIPGDRRVAGRYNFSKCVGGLRNEN